MTLGCQDAQHRTGVPLGPTASNTEVLCWSVYTGCAQAQRAPAAALAQLPLATELAASAHVQEVFQPMFLLPCLSVALLWPIRHGKPQCPSLWEVGRAGREGTPGVLTACGGAARAGSYVRAHRPSFRRGHRQLALCLQQAGRTEVFPVPDVLGIQ